MKTDVISLRRIEGSGNLKAFADIRIGDIVIRGCAVFEGKNGTFATLPRQVSSLQMMT